MNIIAERISFENYIDTIPFNQPLPDDARKYAADISTRLEKLKDQIASEPFGRIIVLVERGGYNYCINGFNGSLQKKMFDELDKMNS